MHYNPYSNITIIMDGNTITTKALNCRANRVIMAKIDYITIKKTSIAFNLHERV